MNIIFLGMKHCGKSTCADAIATEFDCRLYDTDDEMAKFYFEKFGEHCTAKEIFAKHGADYFKEIEYTAIEKLAEEIKESENFHVIALGGASPLNYNCVDLLKATDSIAIWLKADCNTLFERVVNNGPSRFLEVENPEENFRKMYQKREPFYQKYADVTVDTTLFKSLNEMKINVLKIVKDLVTN